MGQKEQGGQQQKPALTQSKRNAPVTIGEVLTLVHDLRNLLLPIQVAAGLLREQNPHGKGQNYLHTILEQTDRIRRLIDDVLLSKDELVWNTAVDLTELVAQVARQVSADLQVGISSGYPRIEPVMVRGSEPRIWRILHNLILNAAEAAGQDGKVNVRLFLEEVERMAVVEIENSGPSIRETVQTQLFAVAGTTTKPNGTGLGLVSVRELVQQLGGDVSFCSEPSKGAVFLVRLPLA